MGRNYVRSDVFSSLMGGEVGLLRRGQRSGEYNSCFYLNIFPHVFIKCLLQNEV